MTNLRFYIALAISLTIHAVILFTLSSQKIEIEKKKTKQLEVIYKDIKQVKKETEIKKNEDLKVVKRKEKIRPKDVKILTEKREFVPTIGENIKDASKLTGKFRLEKKQNVKMHSFDKSQKVSVTLSETEKINNPKYLSYYSIIGGMIKEQVYNILGENETGRGEVYVTFLVGANGILKDILIKDERTVASQYLKDLALKSVRQAAPFPIFPKGLDYPEFTFNIKLYFQPTSEN